MKIITKGHVYQMQYAGNKKTSELIHFIHKVSDPKDPKKKLDMVMDGTTNEEVLAVLIDRMKYLDGILPSKDNREVIRHLEQALACLNRRTAERKKRKVEGTHKP